MIYKGRLRNDNDHEEYNSGWNVTFR
jgi:hypothetical protein